MTPGQLTSVIEGLAETVGSTNHAMEDDDRGAGNKAICLTVYDDGSGRIGYRSHGSKVEDVGDFDSAENAVAAIESVVGANFDSAPKQREAWIEAAAAECADVVDIGEAKTFADIIEKHFEQRG